MDTSDLTGTTALVTGASRGLGRGIATALGLAGAHVVGLARTPFDAPGIEAVTGDATDGELAAALLREHRPRTLVLNAGATPGMGPLTEQTWESFSTTWQTDVQHVFHWARAALLLPLDPGSTVVVVSSGAALRGSPQSGGYAGGKATVRTIAAYAAGESERTGLGLTWRTVFPQLTPLAGVGRAGAAAYGTPEGDHLTPEQVGAAVVALATGAVDEPELLLTAAGPRPLPR